MVNPTYVIGMDMDPFYEGKFKLDQYKYFFHRAKFEQTNSQLIENLAYEYSGSFCYVWIWKKRCASQIGNIVGDLIGVNADCALVFKMMFGVEQEDMSNYFIFRDSDESVIVYERTLWF